MARNSFRLGSWILVPLASCLACGAPGPAGGGSPDAGAEVRGAVGGGAVVHRLRSAPTGAGAPAPSARSVQDAPTFAGDVAPILYRECASCHRPGGSGPFVLLTYRDAAARADRIARSVRAGRMPPWLPEPGYARFAGERRLTAEEMRTVERWAQAGAPRGDPASEPEPPPPPAGGWSLGEPDLVLEPPPYDVPADGRDVYRNLVVAVPASDTLWVRTVELRPGDPRVVHHARLMVDTTASSRAMAAADPAPGFDGMDPRSAAANPDGFFVGWTPGKVAAHVRSDLAWPLPGGADLVLQLHLRPTGTTERVAPRIGLHLADGPPERRTSLVMLGSESIDIPAGDSAYVVEDEYVLPVPVEVLGVYPHAHYLAERMLGYATLPNGERRWLLRIDDWDFNWQDEYRYAEPLELPAGSVLTMRYTYDNSSANPQNPNDPPRRVRYGSQSTDEMADLVIQVLPWNAEDRAVLEDDLRWSYYAKATAREAGGQRRLGDSLAAAGRLDEALEVYRSVLRLSDDPGVMSAMAGVLMQQGEGGAAVVVAQRAVALAPGDPEVLGVLAEAYDAAGRPDEARAAGREAVRAAEARGLRALADSLRGRWAGGSR